MMDIRTLVRPFGLFCLLIGSFYMLNAGTTGEWVEWWYKLTFAGWGEWILERPVLKAVKKG